MVDFGLSQSTDQTELCGERLSCLDDRKFLEIIAMVREQLCMREFNEARSRFWQEPLPQVPKSLYSVGDEESFSEDEKRLLVMYFTQRLCAIFPLPVR